MNNGLMTDAELENASRLQYSRILWKNPRTRRRLLYVWEHPEHPHRERFQENRELIVGLLENADPQAYVEALPSQKWSLRTLTREIPCIIWEFWDEAAAFWGRDAKEECDGNRPPLH